MLLIILIIFLVIFVFLVVSLLLSLLLFVAPVSTPRKVIKRALREAKIKPGESFYDLGCGDGRVLFQASRNYGCRAVGYELNLPVFLLAKFKVILHGKSRDIKIYFKNFLNQDLRKADVIFCYLTPRLMKKLEEKFKKESLKKGTRIISFAFSIKGWQSKKVIKIDPKTPRIYIYEV